MLGIITSRTITILTMDSKTSDQASGNGVCLEGSYMVQYA